MKDWEISGPARSAASEGRGPAGGARAASEGRGPAGRARRAAGWVLLVGVAGVVLAACEEHPRWVSRHPTGEPVPSASTSATPLWLRNRD